MLGHCRDHSCRTVSCIARGPDYTSESLAVLTPTVVLPEINHPQQEASTPRVLVCLFQGSSNPYYYNAQAPCTTASKYEVCWVLVFESVSLVWGYGSAVRAFQNEANCPSTEKRRQWSHGTEDVGWIRETNDSCHSGAGQFVLAKLVPVAILGGSM